MPVHWLLPAITPQPRATSVRLQGLGFPAERRGPRADLVVTLEPRWPTRLNADQRILLDQLAAASAAAGQADAALTDWQRQMRARSAPAGGRSATGSARTRQRRNDTA